MTGRPELPPMRCKHCGGVLRVEWRERLEAKPLGTFSLAGQTLKFSAVKREWPYVICDACELECAGVAG